MQKLWGGKATKYMAAMWMVKKQEWGINRGQMLLPNGEKIDTKVLQYKRPPIGGLENSRERVKIGLAR